MKSCGKKMWKIQVTLKLRMFLWLLAQQSLPTGDVRHHRNMAAMSSCSICGAEDSWRHSLMDFPMSKCVWALVNEEITQHMSMTKEPAAKQWLFSMIESPKLSDLVEMIVTMWAIWYARRRLLHEGEHESPLSTFLFARNFLHELA
jgi:hypothetical protein